MLEEDSRVTGSIILTSGALHIGPNAEVGEDVVLTPEHSIWQKAAVVHGDVILSSEDIKFNRIKGRPSKA